MDQKRKVLMLVQVLSHGGLEWMVAHLVVQMKKRGFWSPQVLVYDHNGLEQLDPFFVEQGIPLTRIEKGHKLKWELVRQIAKFVAQEKFQILHTHHLGALLIAVLVKWFLFFTGGPRVKVIYTQHSFIHLIKYPRYWYLEKWCCFWADALTAVSKQVQLEYKSLGISSRKIHLISNGSRFPETPLLTVSDRQALREKIWQDERRDPGLEQIPKFWWLYLARVHPGKGHEHALELWSHLPPNVQKQSALMYVGPLVDQGYVAKLKSRIESLPCKENILFFEPTAQVPLWMQAADAFLSCSESEGWPLAPMEALGAGLPCFLSHIEGHQMYQGQYNELDLSDLVSGAQVMAEYFKQNQDVEQMSETRSRAWKNGQVWRDRHSIDSMVKNYEELFESLLSRRA